MVPTAQEKYPWIPCLHCVLPRCLFMKNVIRKIENEESLVGIIIGCQNRLGGNQKSDAMLNDIMYIQKYEKARMFLWPPETRFMRVILLLTHSKQMVEGLNTTGTHDAYTSSDCENDTTDERINRDEMWDEIDKFQYNVLVPSGTISLYQPTYFAWPFASYVSY